MSDPTQNWKKVITKMPVHVPSLDGKTIQETVMVEVEALQNPSDGEIYLPGEALEKLDAAKARYMGLLQPDCIKELRERLELTQKEMSSLLQIGEKTWTRWETGRERPSRSLNLLLHAVYDGKVDICYLQLMSKPALRDKPLRATPPGGARVPFTFDVGTASPAMTEKNYEGLPA